MRMEASLVSETLILIVPINSSKISVLKKSRIVHEMGVS